MDSIKVIKTGKKQKLLIDGHFFIKFQESDNIISWCCDKKGTLKCTSIVKTSTVDGRYEIKDGPTEHDHKDPKNRKLIVATPKNAIIGKKKKLSIKLARIKLDFKEKSTSPDHTDSPNKTIPAKTIKKRSRIIGKIPYTDQPIVADFGVQVIKFVKPNESIAEKLLIDGYFYRINSKGKQTCAWACCSQTKEIKCPARVVTIFSSGAHKLKRAPDLHNHDVTLISPSLKFYLDKMECISNGLSPPVKRKRQPKKNPTKEDTSREEDTTSEGATHDAISLENEQTVRMDVSMHTQLMSHLAQADIMQFPPPTDCEIEFVILFGLRRQMLPIQIFYECQSTYGVHAPSFQTVSNYCERFQSEHYPTDVSGSEKRINNKKLRHVKIENEDPNISREILTVQPDIKIF